jgi:FkbM family methyltransferase
MKLYEFKPLRKLVLPLLKQFDRDIKIKHQWTGDRIILSLYKHKGYWYHGRHREKSTMLRFREFIRPTDTVIEVGGHIGYISLYFARCASKGTVHVFEPGANNLRYLEKNIQGTKNIHLHKVAAGDVQGNQFFYMDPITGQNNTLLKDYNVFKKNRSNSGDKKAVLEETTVEVVRLDDFAKKHSIVPNFVKIDTEGFELNVLKGMTDILKTIKPIIMIEVTENHSEVTNLLLSSGYSIKNEDGEYIDKIASDGNYFCH